MKVKSSTLSMLSKAVKDIIHNKSIVLYAQSDDFSSANLGARYVLEIGNVIYTLTCNGSIILSMAKIPNNINYETNDIVELDD